MRPCEGRPGEHAVLVPAMRRLHRAVQRLRRRVSPRAVILMYHRVAEVDADPWGLSVAPAHFAEHLEIIRRYGRPTRLLDLARAQQRGRIPRRAVVVTLDDGYADNLRNAKPLLVQHGVPATVFVTTGMLGRQREFWWDELARLLSQPGRLPRALELRVSGRAHRWERGDGDHDLDGDLRRRRQPPGGGSRGALYEAVYRVLRPLPEDAREKALAQVAAWAGAEAAHRETHRPLSLEELHALADGGVVDIGAHTVTHALLPGHDLAYQRREIQESKQFLEGALGRPIETFAYPHGGYSQDTLALVRQEFLCACSTGKGSVGRHTDPFQLPRFPVGDWDGDEFARRLTRWLAQ